MPEMTDSLIAERDNPIVAESAPAGAERSAEMTGMAPAATKSGTSDEDFATVKVDSDAGDGNGNGDAPEKSCFFRLAEFLNHHCHLDTFTNQSAWSTATMMIWITLMFQIMTLYYTLYPDLTSDLEYPANNLLSTPVGMLVCVGIMIPMIPLVGFDAAWPNLVIGTLTMGVCAAFDWYLLFGWGFDYSEDDMVEHFNNVRGIVNMEDVEAGSQDFIMIATFSSGALVCMLLTIVCGIVDCIKNGDIEQDKVKPYYQRSYVRELLTAVPRGVGAPVVRQIGSHTVLVTWTPATFHADQVRSYRVKQWQDGEVPSCSIVCGDTEEWLASTKNEKLVALSQAVKDAKQKSDKPICFYVAEKLQPGQRYKWKVQPLPKDEDFRRGRYSPPSDWGKIPEIEVIEKPSFKESLMEMVHPKPDEYPPLTLAIVEHPKAMVTANISQPAENFSFRVDMIGWLVVFCAPMLWDQPPQDIEHPSANSIKKRFLGVTTFMRQAMPFKFRFSVIVCILCLVAEAVVVIHYSIYTMRDSLDDAVDDAIAQRSALEAVQAATKQFCDMTGSRDSATDADNMCSGMSSDVYGLVNCTNATTFFNGVATVGAVLAVVSPGYSDYYDAMGIVANSTEFNQTACKATNAAVSGANTVKSNAFWIAWMMLLPSSFKQYAEICLPEDERPLTESMNGIQGACGEIGELEEFPSVEDTKTARDVWPGCLALGGPTASCFTIWFLFAYVCGTVQKVHLLREGKMVNGFKHRDLHKIFVPYAQSTFVGSIFSFYVGGNLICVLLWFVIGLCLAWEPIIEGFTKPLIEYLIYWCIGFVFNMVVFKGWIMKSLTTDATHLYFFKNSSAYYFVDFLLVLYFIPYMGGALVYKVIYGLLIILALIFRMDMTNFGEGVETYDSGFSATMALIVMNERCNNPVIGCFCRIVHRTPLLDNVDGAKSFPKSKLGGKKGQRARIRWHLAYTLIKNPSMIKHRRGRGTNKSESKLFPLMIPPQTRM